MYNLKRMKKLFAILTIFVFIAGIASTGAPKVAMAASNDNAASSVDVKKLTSDITDKDVKDAVLRLAAFGIVNGMEDGKYHPDDTVTREQFAKILVTSLKMDAAAKAAMGRSSFKDVEASRWSAGYINVAAGQGLIKGYPDGTFQPAKQVSYAEAITMLVRALGYRDSFLPGTWPGNYLAKAAEKEITKYVKFSDPTGGANRGDVAILVNNTLDAKVVKVDTYEASGTKYYESEKTLLEDKLNITKYEDTRIIADRRLDDGLEENEVTVKFLKDTDDDKYNENEEKDFDLVEGVNVEPVIGEEVSIYLNDDDEIVYAEREYDDRAYFDYAEELITSGSENEVSLVKYDDDYPFDKNAVVYVNDNGDKVAYKNDGDTNNTDELFDNPNLLLGKVGKFVVKNNRIVFADIMNLSEVNDWMVVKDNKDGIVSGISGDDDAKEVDLTEDGSYDGVIVLGIDGTKLDVSDIEEGNLIYVDKQDIDGDDYAIVWVVQDNVVEGTLDKVKSDRITVGGKEIKFTKYVEDGNTKVVASYTIDNGDDINIYDFDKTDVQSDMEDADGAYITAYTDAVGRIAYFTTEAKATSGYKYGIVTRKYTDSDKLKIYTMTENGEGDEIVYPVEETRNMDEGWKVDAYGHKTGDTADIIVGSVVKFKLNKDGEIAEDEIYVAGDNYYEMTTLDFGKDSIPSDEEYDGKTFSVDDKTVIIDAKGYDETQLSDDPDNDYKDIESMPKYGSSDENVDIDDFSIVKWEELAEDENFTGAYYVFCDDDNDVEADAVIFIHDGCGSASEDEQAVYVVDRWYKGGDLYVEMQPYDASYVDSIQVDSGSESKLKVKERPYIAKVQADGELEIVTPDKSEDFAIYYGIITEKDSSTITANVYNVKDNSYVERKTFKISSKTVVYEEDNKKSTSNLHNGDAIYMVVEDDVNARVIERLIDDENQKVQSKQSPY